MALGSVPGHVPCSTRWTSVCSAATFSAGLNRRR